VFPKDADGNTLTSNVDWMETWKALEECQKKGLTRSIGLSNFNSQQIKRVLDNCTIKPAVLQVHHLLLKHNVDNELLSLYSCRLRAIHI